MQRWMPALVAAATLTGPAVAQHEGEGISPASPDTYVALAGDVILHFVGGRTLEQADTGSFNPFGIDPDQLLYNLGSFFIVADYQGEPVHEGEFSIYPQFTTLYLNFEASPATPPIIPFAFMKAGVCHAGYVTGYPVPDTTYNVDLTDKICHAELVAEAVYHSYMMTAPVEPDIVASPPLPSDIDLDLAAWAAYNAAYSIALSDGLFLRAGDFEPLRAAIASEFANAGLAFEIEQAPSALEALGCTDGGAVLRAAVSADGQGITLVAASPYRQSSYSYDPAVSSELSVLTARECRLAGPGRVPTSNIR